MEPLQISLLLVIILLWLLLLLLLIPILFKALKVYLDSFKKENHCDMRPILMEKIKVKFSLNWIEFYAGYPKGFLVGRL